MRVWIDIDNPAQVQYLVPFRAAFEAAGAETIITARDNGSVVELLAQAQVEAATFGESFGGSKLSKASGLARRARELRRFLTGDREPDALLAASRSAAMVARRLRIPSFIVGDYEWANVSVYVLTRSTILYPDVIDPQRSDDVDYARRQLQPFRGLKEDISFSGIDLDKDLCVRPRARDGAGTAYAVPAPAGDEPLLSTRVRRHGKSHATALGRPRRAGRTLAAASGSGVIRRRHRLAPSADGARAIRSLRSAAEVGRRRRLLRRRRCCEKRLPQESRPTASSRAGSAASTSGLRTSAV